MTGIVATGETSAIENPWRIPAEHPYLAALGSAAYIFTYLEWQIISLGELLEPGFVYTSAKKTAGDIGKAFLRIVQKNPSLTTSARQQLEFVANVFRDLVILRNRLLHAKPATIEGQQRLHYWSRTGSYTWSEKNILDLAARFEAAAIDGNRVYYALAHRNTLAGHE